MIIMFKGINLFLLMIIIVGTVPLVYSFDPDQGLWWDEAVYLSLATNILEGNGYWMNSFGTESFRPPMFPVMIASIWAVAGINVTLIRVLPIIFAILGIIVTYLLGRELFSKEVGVLSSFLLATSHLFLFYSDKMLTESLFIFLSLLSLYVFFIGIKTKKNVYFLLFGVLGSLSMLTRYAGALLFFLYILYPLYLQIRKKGIYKTWGYWAGIGIFIVFAVSPLGLHAFYFGDPLGGIKENSAAVDGVYYGGGPEFYFVNWFSIFGYVGIFALPGLLYFRKWDNNKFFFALIFVIILLFFMFLPRKEERYLLHYFSLFTMLMSLGVVWIKDRLKKDHLKIGLLILVVILAGFSYLTAINNLSNSEDSKALTMAGLYLSDQDITGRIMTQNMPIIHYLSGKEVIYFPDNLQELDAYIQEHQVEYIVLHIWEPTYPEYVWDHSDGKKPSEVFDRFSLEQIYTEYQTPNVWIYKV